MLKIEVKRDVQRWMWKIKEWVKYVKTNLLRHTSANTSIWRQPTSRRLFAVCRF